MNSFIHGFEKTAAGRGKAKAAKGFLESASDFFGGAAKGLKSSGDVALKEHLKPTTAWKGVQEALDVKGGKNEWARRGIAIGKALPAAGVTGGYLYGAKKLYDKTLGSPDSNSQSQYMLNSYYG